MAKWQIRVENGVQLNQTQQKLLTKGNEQYNTRICTFSPFYGKL